MNYIGEIGSMDLFRFATPSYFLRPSGARAISLHSNLLNTNI